MGFPPLLCWNFGLRLDVEKALSVRSFVLVSIRYKFQQAALLISKGFLVGSSQQWNGGDFGFDIMISKFSCHLSHASLI